MLIVTKRNAENATDTGVELLPSDDPEGKARAISNQWYIPSQLTLEHKLKGNTTPERPTAFIRGQFVEVWATLEVKETKSKAKGRRDKVAVGLIMEKVVRLG